jgi:hypothetical protein
MKKIESKLESMKKFKLTIEQESKVNGGLRMATEQCTSICAGQYDCSKDDFTDSVPTGASTDNC